MERRRANPSMAQMKIQRSKDFPGLRAGASPRLSLLVGTNLQHLRPERVGQLLERETWAEPGCCSWQRAPGSCARALRAPGGHSALCWQLQARTERFVCFSSSLRGRKSQFKGHRKPSLRGRKSPILGHKKSNFMGTKNPILGAQKAQ